MSQPAASTKERSLPRAVILAFLRHYLPGFRAGGPIRSIANLVEAVGDEFEFRIVTLDRDYGERRPYPGVTPDHWTPMGGAWVMYVECGRFGIRRVATVAQETAHDVVYLNSFFDPRFTQQVLLARRLRLLPMRPLLIAPRGELSEGALQVKPLRKRAFIAAGRLLRLHAGATWHATSYEEAADIRRRVKGANGRVVVAPNLASTWASDVQKQERAARAPGAPLRICFLSRISRKKNLDYALAVLARVRARVDFTIYGPIEDAEYWVECKKLIARLPPNVDAIYAGELPHREVQPALQRHDILFLPTRNENFGHVILEALSAGLVIVISDQTPWHDLERHGIGWALPLSSQDGFVQILDELASWDAQRFQNAQASANVYAAQIKNSRGSLEATRSMLHAVVTRRAGNISGS
jgi:glycosyltransferase involved in cell wall biosynthesis